MQRSCCSEEARSQFRHLSQCQGLCSLLPEWLRGFNVAKPIRNQCCHQHRVKCSQKLRFPHRTWRIQVRFVSSKDNVMMFLTYTVFYFAYDPLRLPLFGLEQVIKMKLFVLPNLKRPVSSKEHKRMPRSTFNRLTQKRAIYISSARTKQMPCIPQAPVILPRFVPTMPPPFQPPSTGSTSRSSIGGGEDVFRKLSMVQVTCSVRCVAFYYVQTFNTAGQHRLFQRNSGEK